MQIFFTTFEDIVLIVLAPTSVAVFLSLTQIKTMLTELHHCSPCEVTEPVIMLPPNSALLNDPHRRTEALVMFRGALEISASEVNIFRLELRNCWRVRTEICGNIETQARVTQSLWLTHMSFDYFAQGLSWFRLVKVYFNFLLLETFRIFFWLRILSHFFLFWIHA